MGMGRATQGMGKATQVLITAEKGLLELLEDEKQEVESEERSGMPILAIKDRKTGMMQSRVVPSKGNDRYAIKRLKKDIELLGYKKIILKSDNESSILSLKQSVKDF